MTAREIELAGGAPWGFRMHGGVEHNQPLRISRVNPGRKASLSGIREGDVISSINGRATKGMSNAEAHAMLRSAGPVLRLGLNEDREMSPRRRSIGKGSELKRPSQLIAEVQSRQATPQAPVYATIRPSQLPQQRQSPAPFRGSLNSLPTELNSTQLVKSVVQNDEPFKFHPTNPFFTTLPSTYTSVSKLPVPNHRSSLSSLERNKSKDFSYMDHNLDFKSPTIFPKSLDSGPSSLPYYHDEVQHTNGCDSYTPTSVNEKSNKFSFSSQNQFQNENLPRNPFDTKRNSDPFEKYLHSNNKSKNDCEYDVKTMTNSISDNNFRPKEEITKRSMTTEHKITELEEVKTIKKIVMNGCGDKSDSENGHIIKYESANVVRDVPNGQTSHLTKSKGAKFSQSLENETVLSTPTYERSNYFNTFIGNEKDCKSARTFKSPYKGETSAEPKANDVVSKPPVISPRTPIASAPSPTPKREYPFIT